VSNNEPANIRLSSRSIGNERFVGACLQRPGPTDWVLLFVVLLGSAGGITLAINADRLFYPGARAAEFGFGALLIALGWYWVLGKLFNRSRFEMDASTFTFRVRPFPTVRSVRVPMHVIRGFAATANPPEPEDREITHAVALLTRDGAPRMLRVDLRDLKDGRILAEVLSEALQRIRGGDSAYRG
jgi:hypothetical protein